MLVAFIPSKWKAKSVILSRAFWWFLFLCWTSHFVHALFSYTHFADFCLCSWTTLNFFKRVILKSLAVHRSPHLYSQSLERYSFPFLVSYLPDSCYVGICIFAYWATLPDFTGLLCRDTLLLVSSVFFS